MIASRVLGSQPQCPETQNGRVIEVAATSTGRPGKSQRAGTRWFFESHQAKGVPEVRVPVAVGHKATRPVVIIRTAEAAA